MIEIDKIYCSDCLTLMKDIEDKSINLIIADPPYNIGKASWDKIDNYIEWCQSWVLECQRVLAENGSFYLFHNDFMQIIDIARMIRDKTRFVFKQFITWDKKQDNGFAIQRLSNGTMRNYYNGFTEYILYYTFQDETGLTTVMLDTNNFPTLRKYFYDLLCHIGKSLGNINKELGHRKAEYYFYVIPKKHIIETIGQKADHCFRYGSTQWDIPTSETYQELIDNFEIDHWQGFREYESLRLEYESLRYTFNMTYNFSNYSSNSNVWNYPSAKESEHPTQKPQALIENIIKHSSNEGDLILDPFVGSGTSCVASKVLNRHYIGIEQEAEYVTIANKRIEAEKIQPELQLTGG